MIFEVPLDNQINSQFNISNKFSGFHELDDFIQVANFDTGDNDQKRNDSESGINLNSVIDGFPFQNLMFVLFVVHFYHTGDFLHSLRHGPELIGIFQRLRVLELW